MEKISASHIFNLNIYLYFHYIGLFMHENFTPVEDTGLFFHVWVPEIPGP